MSPKPPEIGARAHREWIPPRLIQQVTALVLSPERRAALFVQRQRGNPRHLKEGDLPRASIVSRDGRIGLGTQLNAV